MTYSSSIRYPESSRYIQLHAWQVAFCNGNHCAALLLSVFIAWHEWKLKHDHYYRRANDIAEAHGDPRLYNENAYLFFSTDELIEECMGLYGKKAILQGLDVLVELNVIAIHKNPNPRYHFDKTKYFQFYPAVCNAWINEYSSAEQKNKTKRSVDSFDTIDRAKTPDRLGENARPTGEKALPSGENTPAITNTTINTTNNNQSLNAREDFLKNKNTPSIEQNIEVEKIITALDDLGFPKTRCQYPDVVLEIEKLIEQGAALQDFITAFEVTKRSKGNTAFAAKYLLKAVKHRASHYKNRDSPKPDEYRNDFSKGLDWMGDLVAGE